MMRNVDDMLKKMEDYEKQHPETADLFNEIRKYLDNPFLAYCYASAAWMLELKGYKNPPAKLLDAVAEKLYDDDPFDDARLSVVDEVIKKYKEGALC